MKIVYIVGARPQFIKLALMHKEAAQRPHIEERVIHTGQHFSPNMSDAFFEQLHINIPVINLSIHSRSHTGTIGHTIAALEQPLEVLRPDYIFVFGDTNATLAGALCGKKMGIPVVHIEAGIRTFDDAMPEETNRYLSDRVATINFCCTALGVQNLKREGFASEQIPSQIYNSGDIMLDAYLHYYDQFASAGADYKQPYLLTTLHRRQNIEDVIRLQNIVEALNKIHERIEVVCPLHPNTKRHLEANAIDCRFTIIEPVGYLQMQQLLHHSSFVITDSGGVQREAFFAKKKTLILMPQPFWPEVVANGAVMNCESRTGVILTAFEKLQTLPPVFQTDVFGTGRAAANMLDYLEAYHQEKDLVYKSKA